MASVDAPTFIQDTTTVLFHLAWMNACLLVHPLPAMRTFPSLFQALAPGLVLAIPQMCLLHPALPTSATMVFFVVANNLAPDFHMNYANS